MNRNALALLLFGSLLEFSQPVLAVEVPFDLYGEIDVSRDWVQNGNDDWTSNVTKMGLKGEYDVSDDLAVIYQVEQEVDIVHGGADVDSLFSTRNTFVGVSGAWGKFFFGAHDTPFKKSQGKIDLFNDQLGDIKALLEGEVRARDSWAYHSPTFADGFSLQAMHVPADGNFGASKSAALMYQSGDLYASFAVDADMRKNERVVAKTNVWDSMRGSVQYTPGDWTFGLIVQSSEQQVPGATSETGYIVSVSRKLGALTLEGQWGQSDILAADADQLLLGATYQFARHTSLYGIFSKSGQASAPDTNAFLIGIEYKF